MDTGHSAEAQPDALQRFRRRILRTVLLFVAFCVGGVLIVMLAQMPFYPWARSLNLWQTLTGKWYGELLAPTGRSPVYLEILEGAGNRRNSIGIAGFLNWCDGSGSVWKYEIYGDVDNWRGTRFHFSTRSVVDRESGLWPAEFSGQWNGDEISAKGVLVSHARTASASVSRGERTPDGRIPVDYALRRATEEEFLAACNK